MIFILILQTSRHAYEGDIKVQEGLGAGNPGRPAVRAELGRERTHLEVQSSLYQHPRSHAQAVEICGLGRSGTGEGIFPAPPQTKCN